MKYKRSQIKKVSLKALVLRHMRKTCGLSARTAGQKIGCSGPSIMHYENGRMEISATKLEALVQTYGYTMAEFRNLMANPPKAIDRKQECIGLIERLEEKQVQAIHALLNLMN